VIIDDFDRFRITPAPFEANTPLIVNPNGPLPFSLSSQSLKPVGWRGTKILKLNRRINRVKLHEGTLLNYPRKLTRELTLKYFPGFPAAERPDHDE